VARKYTPKGGAGGKRDGAGRKPGTKNTLALGEVAAVKAAGLRVPESATEAQRALADRALQRIAAVMEEKVGAFASTAVLKASTHIREEICGAIKQKVEHSGLDGLTDEQLEAKARAAAERLAQLSGGAGTTANAAAQSKGDSTASLGPDGDESE
jgi:uncharacterized protein YgbK (DUF1537 family)